MLMPLVLGKGGATGWNHLPALWNAFGGLKSAFCVIKAIQKMAQKNVLGGAGREIQGSSFHSLSEQDQGNLGELMKLLQVLQFGSCSLRGTINY